MSQDRLRAKLKRQLGIDAGELFRESGRCSRYNDVIAWEGFATMPNGDKVRIGSWQTMRDLTRRGVVLTTERRRYATVEIFGEGPIIKESQTGKRRGKP